MRRDARGCGQTLQLWDRGADASRCADCRGGILIDPRPPPRCSGFGRREEPGAPKRLIAKTRRRCERSIGFVITGRPHLASMKFIGPRSDGNSAASSATLQRTAGAAIVQTGYSVTTGFPGSGASRRSPSPWQDEHAHFCAPASFIDSSLPRSSEETASLNWSKVTP